MHLQLLSAAVLVIGTWLAIRVLGSWFCKHEEEAASISERLFERPDKLEKVRDRLAACGASQIPVSTIFGEPTKSLTIVIPAYNEEKRLPSTLTETLRYLQRRRDVEGATFTYEVIVVDDGSSDSTVHQAFEQVRRHGLDTVRVLQLARNHGKGYAVKAGMLVGRGQLLLFMDADGATRISDVKKLEIALTAICSSGDTASEQCIQPQAVSQRERLGVAVGSRAHLEERAISQRSWYRNLLMHGFHFMAQLVAGGTIKDTQCGFKLFTRKAAQILYCNQRLQRWCFDVELLFLAQRLAVPVVETSVNWTEVPGSKVSVTSIIHMTWEMAAILIAYRWLRLWNVRSFAELNRQLP